MTLSIRPSSLISSLTLAASSTHSLEYASISATIFLIWLADSSDCSANFLISLATTPKPRPASPALAASMLAFSDNKLVCDAMSDIIFTMSLILYIESCVDLILSAIKSIALDDLADESDTPSIYLRASEFAPLIVLEC